MARPRKARCVRGLPVSQYYKPQGIPLAQLLEIVLGVDGLEALRLADAEGQDHAAAAASMRISRPTFTRLLAQARKTVATALVGGMALRIEGGDYDMIGDDEAQPQADQG